MLSTLRAFRFALDALMVRVVQTFMLLQVGVFYLLLRLRTPRLSRAERDAWRSPPSTPPRTISVIVPAYNEARVVGACLAALARNATDLGAVEVIVVDAGCTDGTMAAVAAVGDPLAARLRTTAAPAGGRGRAVNAGVRLATGEIILVLHADTLLPAGWDYFVRRALADPANLLAAFRFGCNRALLARPDAPPAGLAYMEWTVHLRSTWYELPFGDQALATTARALELAGGYPAHPILEEYALVNRLRRAAAAGAGRLVTLAAAPALCSPRRWERTPSSVWRTNAVNQAVMLWHRSGATPAQIFAFYYGVPSPGPDIAWAALSRCTNGERAAAWAAAFAARRACFVHVPRCAGTSVEAAVFGLPFFSQHLSAAQLSRLLGADAYASCVRFAFVRDPLERYLSAFAYLQRRGSPEAGRPVSPHDTLAAAELAATDPLALLRRLAALPSWDDAPLHFRPQRAFVGDAKALDFVGRFERLEGDFASLLALLKARGVAPAATALPHHRLAAGSEEVAATWRASAELRALVREVYADDYAAFGY